MKPQVDASTIDLCLELKADERFLEREPKMRSVIQLAEMRLRKSPQGYLHVPLTGTLGSLRLRADGRMTCIGWDELRMGSLEVQALARLRGEFDRHGGSLTLKGLDPRHLSADQAASVIEAKALVEGIQEVEFAFRDWIADENGLSVPASIRKLAIWHLAGPQEPDIARLSQVIEDSSKDTLARNILQHHRHLSMTRGAPSWEPGSGLPTVRQRILPDFTLKALRNLFDEGVRPRVDA